MKNFKINMELPICNKKPDRAPSFNGFTFLLCWRCTMVIVSILFVTFLLEVFSIPKIYIFNITCIVMLFPMIIDGGVQYLGIKNSTNFRRALTGFFFGCGVALILYKYS
ncbi:MAG: DUF2085 domain-containing protein [Eubacteriales bacterium]